MRHRAKQKEWNEGTFVLALGTLEQALVYLRDFKDVANIDCLVRDVEYVHQMLVEAAHRYDKEQGRARR